MVRRPGFTEYSMVYSNKSTTSTVGFFFALLVRRTETDDGLAADDGRTIRNGTRLINRLLDGFRIMAVNLGNNVPAIGFKALRRVIEEPAGDIAVTTNFAVDGDVVVVVEGNQLAELHGACQ